VGEVISTSDPTRETLLRPGELIVAVELPAEASSGTQTYTKLMQRGAWDFALVSLAAVRHADGTVRLVLGGVAGSPWEVDRSVEEQCASGRLAEDDVDSLVDRALYDAHPLDGNEYKVVLARSLLRRGIRFVAGLAKEP
jgi:xanthine dehydrogenase YagS FAD-binding subunit